MSSVPFHEAPPPYVPPPSEAPNKVIINLRFIAPLQWLRAAWIDMRAHPGVSVFYGLCFWLMALILGMVFRNSPEYTLTIASGCLLVGPFLAMGLYDVSRRREAGLVPDLASSVTCWHSHVKSMGTLVLVLIVLELLWGRASLVVFAVFFNSGMPSSAGVMDAIFNPQNWEFVVAFVVVGGIFAAIVFAISAVSIPMILDRDTDAISAAITSLEVIFHNTAVMLLWGALITLLIALSLLLPWGVGILAAGPLLGHGTWYAYRGAVQWPQDVTVP